MTLFRIESITHSPLLGKDFFSDFSYPLKDRDSVLMILQLCDGAKRPITTKRVELLLGVYHVLSKDSLFSRFNRFLD